MAYQIQFLCSEGKRERERERGGSEKEISLFQKLCDSLDKRKKIDNRDTNSNIVTKA